MSDAIKAIVARQDDNGRSKSQLETISTADLPDLPVLVKVNCSTLNYKDGLAVTGKGKICRRFPMVCGIDLAGEVEHSEDARFNPGDRVLVNGYGLSEAHWGGYAQKQRLNGDWLIKTPEAFSDEHAMAIGTAGYTAMLSVMALQDHGLTPADGPVAVTGASGGVGSVALTLLSRLGFETVAVTGRPDENKAYFESLGAGKIIGRDELAREAKPLESETYAAAIDSVGDKTLATLLAQIQREGIVAACGLAGGVGLPTTVMPFILRGVTLRGIDSVMAGQERRRRAWSLLADLLKPEDLTPIFKTAPLGEVPSLANALLKGEITGRYVIDVNAV